MSTKKKMASYPENGNGWSQRYATLLQTVTVIGLFVGAVWVAIISPIENRIDKIERNAISLREYQAFQKAVEEHFDRSQGDIKELRGNVMGTYSAKDAISNIQRQIDLIRERLFRDNVPDRRSAPLKEPS